MPTLNSAPKVPSISAPNIGAEAKRLIFRACLAIAILENNQQADGSVLVPEVLRPWVGKERIIPPSRARGAWEVMGG